MSTPARRTALVTGASTGIGEAFARHLGSRGLDLVLTARDEGRLHRLGDELERDHAIRCHVVAADLVDPESPDAIFERLGTDGIEVDVLVNNAGYALSEDLIDIEWPKVQDYMQVMATAWLHFIHLFAPPMAERGWGRILNIASLAAFAPEPPGGLYSGLKTMMVTTSRGLRVRLRPRGVHVTAVCPGFTYTEFHARAGMPEVERNLPSWMWQRSDAVAREGWKACERNRAVVVTGRINRLLRAILAVVPPSLAERGTPRSIKDIRSRKAGDAESDRSAV